MKAIRAPTSPMARTVSWLKPSANGHAPRACSIPISKTRSAARSHRARAWRGNPSTAFTITPIASSGLLPHPGDSNDAKWTPSTRPLWRLKIVRDSGFTKALRSKSARTSRSTLRYAPEGRRECLRICLPNVIGVQRRAPEGGAKRRRKAPGSCNALLGSRPQSGATGSGKSLDKVLVRGDASRMRVPSSK